LREEAYSSYVSRIDKTLLEITNVINSHKKQMSEKAEGLRKDTKQVSDKIFKLQ
jgi:hypothetical protein